MEAKKSKTLNKYLLIILFTLLLHSCFQCGNENFNKCEIELLALEDSIMPSKYNNYHFFCRGEHNSIVKLQYKELMEVFTNQFYDMNYNNYLLKLLNQQLIIQTKNRYFFILNDTIVTQYNNNTFDVFLALYCKKTDNSRYRIIRSFSENELDTYSYFVFINGYFIVCDDYIGTYYIIPKTRVLGYCGNM